MNTILAFGMNISYCRKIFDVFIKAATRAEFSALTNARRKSVRSTLCKRRDRFAELNGLGSSDFVGGDYFDIKGEI